MIKILTDKYRNIYQKNNTEEKNNERVEKT